MSGLRLAGFVFASTLPLFAQQLPLAQYIYTQHQLADYKGNEDAVRSVMNYCDAVDDSLQQQQPRIFAESKIDSSPESKSSVWRELASREDWYAAGKPAPLAFVWDRDGAIVRVTIVARPPRGWNRVVGAHQQVDYCYGTDTHLIRIRAVWYEPTYCEFLFPCRLISGHEFFLRGQRPAITDWVFAADGTIEKLRNGKAVDDYFDPSNSLSASDLHLRTSDDLPFDHIAPPK